MRTNLTEVQRTVAAMRRVARAKRLTSTQKMVLRTVVEAPRSGARFSGRFLGSIDKLVRADLVEARVAIGPDRYTITAWPTREGRAMMRLLNGG